MNHRPFPFSPATCVLAAMLMAISGEPTLAQVSQATPPGQMAAAPQPTHANLDYAPADPPTSNGHKLDLYIPAGVKGPLPVVIWTGGSAWMADTGKSTAGSLADWLNPAGYVVAGVSIRSSSQVTFPGQLHDIKAAIRWLRANAARYGVDPDHIAVMGDSSGGWTAAMAAVTGDAPDMEGTVGTTGVPSRVQAAVAFYPPTNFLTMDAWALERCNPGPAPGRGQARGPGVPATAPGGRGGGSFCHDGESSPESRLVGCAIQSCPERVRAASPLNYVSAADPPMLILHGQSDQLVPHNQGESLYMALNKACKDAVFISLPRARHGNWNGFLTDDAMREAAVMRSTASAGCAVGNPAPYTPTRQTVIDFLNRYLKK